MLWSSTNFAYSLPARVDSAFSGRNAALSFSWTSASWPANDPSGPPTKSQSSTTTAGSSHRRERREWRPAGAGAGSVEVAIGGTFR